MSAETEIAETLRETIREYRKILEMCYFKIQKHDPQAKILDQLKEYGIGDSQPKPIFDRRDIDDEF